MHSLSVSASAVGCTSICTYSKHIYEAELVCKCVYSVYMHVCVCRFGKSIEIGVHFQLQLHVVV